MVWLCFAGGCLLGFVLAALWFFRVVSRNPPFNP